MWMSISTMSAPPSVMRSTADSPVSHSPAITKSSIAARVAAVARRKLAWSSTTHTRTRSSITRSSCRGCLLRARVYTPPFAVALVGTVCRSVVAEEQQHGLDAPINGVVDRQFQFGEDRVDVLLHGSLRQHQPRCDGSVAEPRCEFAEHVAFPRSESA